MDGSDVSWNAMRVCAGLFKYTRDQMRVLHITKVKYLPGKYQLATAVYGLPATPHQP